MEFPDFRDAHPDLVAINEKLFSGGKTCDHMYELGRLSVKAEAAGDARLLNLIKIQMGIYQKLEGSATDDGK